MNRAVAVATLSQALLVGALLLSDGPAAACWLLWIASQAIVMIELLRPRSRLFGPNFWRGRRQPRVALTFDDGPHPDDTPAILDILKASDTRATFFFVGSRARHHPDLVRRAAREGHEIGAHSDTHPWWFSLAGPARLRREVRDAVDTLERITQKRPRYFRPPMGHKNFFLADELSACGLRMITWSARPYDTLGGSPMRIRKAVAARTRPGGIVLLHEGVLREPGQPSATVSALAGIIEELNARGLVPVSLGDLEEGSAPVSPPGRAASGPATGADKP